MDSKNGYVPTTKFYHSLYPSIELPHETLSLSAANFALSLLRSAASTTTASLDTITAFIDGGTGQSLSFSEFLSRVHSLAHSLTTRNNMPLSKGDVALILSPPSIHVPVLYFALLSLGIVVFPTDPLANDSTLAQLVRQAKPAIAFTVSSLSKKLASLPYSFSHGTILINSAEFDSMLTFRLLTEVKMSTKNHKTFILEYSTLVSQTDTAAMISSSSTTGPAKIVELTHRNIIASLSAHGRVLTDNKGKLERPVVSLLTSKIELVLGFVATLTSVATAQSMVVMERSKDLAMIMESLERYKVNILLGYPMLVGAMAVEENAEVVNKYDVSSLRLLICGGMQLHERYYKLFKQKFPKADIMQTYGLTEICGGAALQIGAPVGGCYGTVGRLSSHLEAKIVNPSTGQALPPGHQGELWLRGPSVMKGYVEDEELTSIRLDCREGWLKTGDMCYFDSLGFLHFVDRLKEFITVNSHQVSPSEIEKILLLHPEIEDAVVAPFPDDGGYGKVLAALVIKNIGSTITKSQIMDFVATKVDAEYKKIQHVRFISSAPNFGKENSLPISHQGKIQRKLMLDQYTVFN